MRILMILVCMVSARCGTLGAQTRAPEMLLPLGTYQLHGVFRANPSPTISSVPVILTLYREDPIDVAGVRAYPIRLTTSQVNQGAYQPVDQFSPFNLCLYLARLADGWYEVARDTSPITVISPPRPWWIQTTQSRSTILDTATTEQKRARSIAVNTVRGKTLVMLSESFTGSNPPNPAAPTPHAIRGISTWCFREDGTPTDLRIEIELFGEPSFIHLLRSITQLGGMPRPIATMEIDVTDR